MFHKLYRAGKRFAVKRLRFVYSKFSFTIAFDLLLPFLKREPISNFSFKRSYYYYYFTAASWFFFVKRIFSKCMCVMGFIAWHITYRIQALKPKNALTTFQLCFVFRRNLETNFYWVCQKCLFFIFEIKQAFYVHWIYSVLFLYMFTHAHTR